MKRMLSKKKLGFCVVLVGLDVMFFGLTSPANVSAILLITGFILLVVNIYVLFTLLVKAALGWPSSLSDNQKNLTRLALFFIAFVLALQSMGQLVWYDILALAPLVGLLYVYLHYFSRSD